MRPLALLLVLLAVPGCGYTLLSGAQPLAGVKSIAIRTPRNESFQAGVEYMVADALRKEALRRGAARLTDDPAHADLVVMGNVLPIQTAPRSFSSVVLAIEYDVTMSVAMRARRSDGKELVFDPNALTETERYLASADVEAQRRNRQEALRRVSQVIAARFFDALQTELAP